MNLNVYDQINQPSLWLYLSVFGIPYFLSFAIAFYWPAYFSPFDLDFTQATLARMVPSVSAYIDKSAFPHATAAYFALSSILVIPAFIFSIANPVLIHRSKTRFIKNYEKFKASRLKAWSAVLVMLIGGIWISWIQPGYELGIIPISKHRWALALAGYWFSFYFMTTYLIISFMNIYYLEKLFRLERKHHGVE